MKEDDIGAFVDRISAFEFDDFPEEYADNPFHKDEKRSDSDIVHAPPFDDKIKCLIGKVNAPFVGFFNCLPVYFCPCVPNSHVIDNEGKHIAITLSLVYKCDYRHIPRYFISRCEWVISARRRQAECMKMMQNAREGEQLRLG